MYNAMHDEVPNQSNLRNNRNRIYILLPHRVLYIHTHDNRIMQLLSSGRPLSDYSHPDRAELVHQGRMEADNG